MKIPIVDSIFYLRNCNYVQIEDLEFIGSRVFGVDVIGGTGTYITNCKFSYCAAGGIHTAGSTNFSVYNNEIFKGQNGLSFIEANSPYAVGNVIHNIDVSGVLDDVDGAAGNGIYWHRGDAYFQFNKNYIDSVNCCGIHMHHDGGDTHPDYDVAYNFVSHWGLMKTDVGAIYTVTSEDNQTKRIRSNIVWEAGLKPALAYGRTFTHGIYFDNINAYMLADSNTIYKSPTGFYINYGGNYNTMQDNTIVNNNVSSAEWDWSGGLVAESHGGTDNMTFIRNLVVESSAAFPFINWNGANDGVGGVTWDCGSCDIDHNKYANYNSINTSDFLFREFYSNYNSYGFTGWQTFTGLEAASNEEGSAGALGINFRVFTNWSSTAHTFYLGSGVIWEDYDETQYSGNLLVPPYKSKVLWYVSGTISNADPQLFTSLPYTGGVEDESGESCAALYGGTIAGNQSLLSGGNPVAFTSTTSAYGGEGEQSALTYSWQYSTTSSTPGSGSWTTIASNSTTIDPGITTATTYWVRRVQDMCDPAQTSYSNVLTITIVTCSALNGGTIAGNQSISSGDNPAAFTNVTVASGGSGALTYAWQWSTTSATAGVGTWTTIASNTSTYDVGITTITTYWVRRVRDACTVVQTAYSNVLTITVTDSGYPPAGWLIFKDQGVYKYPFDEGVLQYIRKYRP